MATECETSDRPFQSLQNVSPADNGTNVRFGARGLILLSAGNLTVVDANGQTIAFVGLPAGYILPCETLRLVKQTGTTASVADGL